MSINSLQSPWLAFAAAVLLATALCVPGAASARTADCETMVGAARPSGAHCESDPVSCCCGVHVHTPDTDGVPSDADAPVSLRGTRFDDAPCECRMHALPALPEFPGTAAAPLSQIQTHAQFAGSAASHPSDRSATGKLKPVVPSVLAQSERYLAHCAILR